MRQTFAPNEKKSGQMKLFGAGQWEPWTLQTSAVCAIWLVITYLDKIKFTMIRLSYFIGKTMNDTF